MKTYNFYGLLRVEEEKKDIYYHGNLLIILGTQTNLS